MVEVVEVVEVVLVEEEGGGKKAPVWSGADAGSFKIIDKASLKTHRENVRKGR
jgi:hypothetical protein